MNLLFLLVWFAVCADQDARSRKVPNVLTLGGVLFAAAYLLIGGHTWLGASRAEGAWALLLALVLTLPGYTLGKLGAGDVKLLIALALATDSLYLSGTLVGAAVFSLIWLWLRQKTAGHVLQQVTNHYPGMCFETSKKQPFVPFLFAGFVVASALLR